MQAPIEFLCDRIASMTGVDRARVQPASRFIDFGINSVQAMDLVIEVEQRFAVTVDDRDLADLRTLADLAAYVEGRSRS